MSHNQKPVLYFMAIGGGSYQSIAAYSIEEARDRAEAILGRVSDFYQVFPTDVDYSEYPDVQRLKDIALTGRDAHELR